MSDPSRSPVPACPVNSHNEWDPLEEVIVGSLDGAAFPAWRTINELTVPPGVWDGIEQRMGGRGIPYPPALVAAAQRQLDNFVRLLEDEGVTVRRAGAATFTAPFSTPDWSVPSGFCAASPRDPFLVIGDEIIETPMADRNRYFEAAAYRPLFKSYFRAGARWTAAPRPQLLDALYDPSHLVPANGEEPRFVVTEFEPVFDAADFVRCGRDLFCQLSHATNRFGIEWLERHLGDGYRVHVLRPRNPEALHIDITFMPLAPGKVLINPEHLDESRLPSILRRWDILVAPEPPRPSDPLTTMTAWAGLNVLMLDEQRVVVEERQEPLIRALRGWGFTPIPCAFEEYYPFVGSFHCATLDIRRRGGLRSYF